MRAVLTTLPTDPGCPRTLRFMRLLGDVELDAVEEGVGHDLAATDAVSAARLDLRSAPEPERDGDRAGEHVFAQFLAELHAHTLLPAAVRALE